MKQKNLCHFTLRRTIMLTGVLASAVLFTTMSAAFHQGEAQSQTTPAGVTAYLSDYPLTERMKHFGVPGVAIGIIQDGQLVHAEGYGVLQAGSAAKVTADTLFSAGSVSKVATAALIVKMAATEQVDIDEDIRAYLKSWQLPASVSNENTKVTLRMILSHTAGFSIHGFADFLPGEALPTVYDTLNGTGAARDAALKFLTKPGTHYKYSGGGYTVAQLLVTEIGGQDFPTMAKNLLLEPLGMSRSSFENPLPSSVGNIAKAHDRDGNPVALPQGYEVMPEMAASGLWTSARELGQMVVALIESYRTDTGYLPQLLASDMMTEVSPSVHGLGPRLEGTGQGRFFHHGGANDSYKTWIEGHLVEGDGLVVLTNGANGSQVYQEIRNAVAEKFGWSTNKAASLPAIPVNPDILAGYAGQYAPDERFPLALREELVGWSFDLPLNLTFVDGTLRATFQGSPNSRLLVPTAPNRFIIDGVNSRVGIVELVLHRNSYGKTNAMSLVYPGAQSFYNRVEPAE